MLELLKKIYDVLQHIVKLLTEGLHKHIQSKDERVKATNTANTDEIALRTMYGIPEVMEILGISYATYYRFVKSGALIPRRLGSRHYYYPEDLEAQIDESRRRGRK